MKADHLVHPNVSASKAIDQDYHAVHLSSLQIYLNLYKCNPDHCKIFLRYPCNTDKDAGTYLLDSSGQFVTISGTEDDDYIFKYYISDVTADGMVLTTDKVYGYFSGSGYGILELKLKKP